LFLESISLGSGALLIAVLSTVIAWLLRSRLSKNQHSLSAVIVPFVLAYCLYWSPVWLGSDDVAQYDAWAGMIVLWFLAGFFPSAVMVLIIQKRRSRTHPET
jgi:hypothetical protein